MGAESATKKYQKLIRCQNNFEFKKRAFWVSVFIVVKNDDVEG